MERHQHAPIEFYSDAFEKPIMVKCEECGEVLDISADLLNSKYGDGPADNVKYLGMTENGTEYTP